MNANYKFFLSILFIPFVLLVNNIFVSFSVCFLFFILILITKKKVRLLPSLLLIISIVFFSILQPSGKLLFSVANFHITLGSILLGLEKSFKLLSMVYISQYAINKNLKVNGRMGMFFNEILAYFDKLTTSGKSFNIKNSIESIDKILLEVYNSKW